MKLIELHILQSFPVSCLNRDDVGSPKTAVFGGVQRARLSSQCLKRASRLAATELVPSFFMGERTRLIIVPIKDRLVHRGLEESRAGEISKLFCDSVATFDSSAEAKGVQKVKTMTMFSPLELDCIADSLVEIVAKGGFDTIDQDQEKRKAQAKKLKPALDAAKKSGLKDAADIAIYGRMVASDHSLTLEGAAMFSHALSTHKASNEVDFWTAVDDRQAEDPTVAEQDRAGGGGMGTAEFSSGTYYRYVALNLGVLSDSNHLGALTPGERKTIARAFIRAVLTAVPGARKNSMNAATLPFEVLGIRKSSGQPIQLINAFEDPVRANGKGLAAASLAAMKAELEKLKKTWGIEQSEVWLTESGIEAFLDQLTQDVE